MRKNKTSKNRKPTFAELVDALRAVINADKAANYYLPILLDCMTGFEECESNLSQLQAVGTPVIAMLAGEAWEARMAGR